MKILISGIGGRMGAEVKKMVLDGYRGAELLVGVDPSVSEGEAPIVARGFREIEELCGVDCIVDFSHHSCVFALLAET